MQPDDSAAVPVVEVVVSYSGGGVRHVPLVSPSIRIGRMLDNDVVLPGIAVSRHHARLDLTVDGWTLTDLGSTHGTAVAGVQLAPHAPALLGADDAISIGGFGLRLWQPENAETGGLPIDRLVALDAIRVDEATREVMVHGSPLRPALSRSEFNVLQALAAAEGRVCSYDDLGQAVWGKAYRDADRFYRYGLYQLIHTVRGRLSEAGAAGQPIVAVRKVGYRLVNGDTR